jgi:hypothetical protein
MTINTWRGYLNQAADIGQPERIGSDGDLTHGVRIFAHNTRDG